MTHLYRSLFFFALVTSLFLTSPASSTGMELCHRNHIFTVDNVTNGTSVTYTNSHTSDTLTITIDDDFLPTTTVCGHDHERCNLIITLNQNGTILVVIFPLETGLGMVSYDVTIKDTLNFREKTVVPQILGQCTFMYLLNTGGITTGFCLDINGSRLYSLNIFVNFSHLLLSLVLQPVSKRINNIASLSNFIYILSQNGGKRCFDTGNDRVVFMESGDLFGYDPSLHVFDNRGFTIDRSCVSRSKLTAMSGMCELAAQCGGVLSFVDVSNGQKTVFPEDALGQLFPCPDGRFVAFRNMTLTLYTDGGRESNSKHFPIDGPILYGECSTMNQRVVFLATLNDSRTVLVDLDGGGNATLYRQLDESDPPEMSPVPAKFVGDLAFVNNGSESLVYDLGTVCVQEPISVTGNFVLATVFTTSTIDVCRCPPNLSPISPSSTLPLPTSSPTIDPSSESQVKPIAIAVPVVCVAVVVLVCALVTAFLIIGKKKLCVQSKEERSSIVDGRNGGFPLVPKELYSNKCNADAQAVDVDSAKALLDGNSTPVPLGDSDEHIAHPPSGGCTEEDEVKQRLKLLENYDASGRTEPESDTILGQNGEHVPVFFELTEGSSYGENFRDVCCTQPHSAVDEGNSRICAGSPHHVKNIGASLTGNQNYRESDEYRSVSPDNGVTPQLETAVQRNESSVLLGPVQSSSSSFHPEYVMQSYRRRTDRENQQTLRDAANVDAVNGSNDSPNNDVNVNRQLSTTSEENGS